jgi:capsular exopolysaccharide synthesis family protein
MSKTYEALKKAEAERERQAGEETKHSLPVEEAGQPSGTSTPENDPLTVKNGHPIPSPSDARSVDEVSDSNSDPVAAAETNGHSFAHSDIGSRPLSPNLEAQYQRLFTTLVVQQKPQQIKTLMLVGANHGDGVTTSASLFARALAKSRTVLLVDANLRTPALAEIFHIRSHQGFADFLARKVTLDGVITPTEEPNLFVMTSGSAALAPPYIFEAGAFDELLATLKDKFDYIMFDAAPLGLHLDSVFLASRVDGVILVVKAETTQVDLGLSIKKRLEDAGAQLLGVVVNQAQQYIPKALRQLLA